MNTNTHNDAAEDVNDLSVEVRARVPKWMKNGVGIVVNGRTGLGEADIVREAVEEYLSRRKIKAPRKAVAA